MSSSIGIQSSRFVDLHLGQRVSIPTLLQAVQNRDKATAEASALSAAGGLIRQVKPPRNGRRVDYVSEENLLAHHRRVADFYILVLADHFRSYYSIRTLPAPTAAKYLSRLRLANVRLRLSGHVTGTFAEAMAPWALSELNIAAPGRTFRLRRLEPSAFQYAPDLVIVDDPPIPVEVKHALDESQINADRLSRALLQVAVGMFVMQSPVGYLVICTGMRPAPVRYSIQVIPIGK